MLKSPTFLERHHKAVLITVGLALIVLNFFYSPVGEDFYAFRILRPVICFSYLILFLFGKNKNDLIQVFLIIFAVSSLFSIWFHVQWVAILTMGLETIALFYLVKMVYRMVLFKNPGVLLSIALGVVAAICGLLLVAFINILSPYLETLFLVLTICALTATFFVLLVLAFIYHNEANSRDSLVFIFYLIFLVFSDMLRGAGYYEFVDPIISQQIGRALLIISYSLLCHFIFMKIRVISTTEQV